MVFIQPSDYSESSESWPVENSVFFSFWLHHVACGVPCPLTRDWAPAPRSEHAGVSALGHQGAPKSLLSQEQRL